MRIEKHIYVNIVRSEGADYYRVILTKTCDIIAFNTVIKHDETIEEIPFYFKSLDMAKDFCNMLPNKITKKVLKRNIEGRHNSYVRTYTTYELTCCNNKKAYIYWDKVKILKNASYATKVDVISETNVVNYFVPSISLYDTEDSNSSGAYYPYNENYEKLTDLINYLNKDTRFSKNEEEYKFELIAQVQ